MMEEISFKPIWFDSLGAKSSCTLIETNEVKVLVDPGVAVMHPSFPASYEQKMRWFNAGYRAIVSASANVDVIVISHYHYDHFIDFDEKIYAGKTILLKNPNEYINDSQRGRAENFFKHLCEAFARDRRLEELLEERAPRRYGDPLRDLPLSQSLSFGDYDERRRELLDKGWRWYLKRVNKWNRWRKIPELDLEEVKVRFPEGKTFRFGATRLRFSRPMFHGIEYSRVGWVFATIVERKGEKIIHSSDLNGPIIEDYSDWIIGENPNVLILDGPMTYMLGYTLNLINFRRTLRNAIRIIKETDAELIIYDHHLPREPKFRDRTHEVWTLAEKLSKRVRTAAEFLGRTPVVLQPRGKIQR